jgi:hypothetical protein
MKTDPAASINGPAATSLAYHAIESGKQTARQAMLKSKSRTAISDTVETGDRDGDGRETVAENDQASQEASPQPNQQPAENGNRLDLTG